MTETEHLGTVTMPSLEHEKDTLRDKLAGHAITGILSGGNVVKALISKKRERENGRKVSIAELAYEIADKMIVARQGAAPTPVDRSGGWQAIDTAPKNTKVLAAYQNDLGNWRIVTACYHTQLDWSDEYGDHEEEYAPEAWYEENDSSDVIYMISRIPTHWMPLPAVPGGIPPSKGSGGEMSSEKFTLKELSALFPDGVPLMIMKLLFPEKSEPLNTSELRQIARAIAARTPATDVATIDSHARQPFTVTIWAEGDHENTAAEAVHHALSAAYSAGHHIQWSDALAASEGSTDGH